jgi:hypothetical protein
MTVRCPNCKRTLRPMDINEAEDKASCTWCGTTVNLSDRINTSSVDLKKIPDGISFEKKVNGFCMTVSTFSELAFLLFAAVPANAGFIIWEIMKTNSSVLALAILILFECWVISYMVLAAIGQITIIVDEKSGTLFRGVGSLGLTKPFNWDEVRAIREITDSHGEQTYIEIQGHKNLRFGSLLMKKRRDFVLQALKEMHRLKQISSADN